MIMITLKRRRYIIEIRMLSVNKANKERLEITILWMICLGEILQIVNRK